MCVLCGGGKATGMHQLSYSVTGMPTRDRVFFSVDRQYDMAQLDGSPLWVFYIARMTDRECAYVSEFLRSQLDIQFNKVGMYANFACPPCLRCPLTSIGCKFDEEFRYADRQSESGHGWFCSELAVAAVQWSGVCHGFDPCCVSPNLLLASVHHSDKFQLAGGGSAAARHEPERKVASTATSDRHSMLEKPSRKSGRSVGPFAAAHAKAIATKSMRSSWV